MRKPKTSTLRTLSAVAVIGLVCAGLAFHTGTGTPSSFGIYDIAALCPLGAVEAAIATKTIVPPLLIGALIVVALTVLVGRAFCAWGCPVPLLRRIFGVKDKAGKGPGADRAADGLPPAASDDGAASAAGKVCDDDTASAKATAPAKAKGPRAPLPAKDRGGAGDSRNWVLGGAVLSTAVLGFPVFCLICPVGLTFATIIALWRLFQFSETTLSLLVFPALLIIEVVVLRKWCHRFCPIGALLSLIARLNRTFQPTVEAATCLHGKGTEGCSRCAEACPEGINLHEAATSAPLHECTRCGMCQDVCPTKSISYPFRAPRRRKQQEGAVSEVGEELLVE